MRQWAKRKLTLDPVPVTHKQVRGQLALAAGNWTAGNRDPVSSVTEDFHQTFDSIGRRRAKALSGAQEPEGAGRQGVSTADRQIGQIGAAPNSVAQDGAEAARTAASRRGRASSSRETAAMGNQAGGQVMPESGIPLEKFSQTAFRNGVLSASVLGGTGKMMLVSCLKRTAGLNDLNLNTTEPLFGTGGQTRNVPGRQPDKMLFNRGTSDNAVGLVVDTLRDARQSVESLREMALGTGEMRGGVESRTLLRMYPFLDDSQERRLIAEYETRLTMCKDAGERSALQNGLVHARAMLDRKASMKEEFINKLRQISDSAVQALEEFEAPGFAEEVWQAITAPEEDSEGLPPEDGGTPPEDGGTPPEDGDTPPEDRETPPEDGGQQG